MDKRGKEAIKAIGATGAGAAVGAGVYAAIGGIGVAAVGTAVGVTLGPFIAIGAGVGMAGYGIFWLGKQMAQRGASPPGFWLNIDYPTKDAKLHVASCKHAEARSETPRKGVDKLLIDGGWLPFPTQAEAAAYVEKNRQNSRVTLSKCGDCLAA